MPPTLAPTGFTVEESTEEQLKIILQALTRANFVAQEIEDEVKVVKRVSKTKTIRIAT